MGTMEHDLAPAPHSAVSSVTGHTVATALLLPTVVTDEKVKGPANLPFPDDKKLRSSGAKKSSHLRFLPPFEYTDLQSLSSANFAHFFHKKLELSLLPPFSDAFAFTTALRE